MNKKILAITGLLLLAQSPAFAILETVKGAQKDVESFKRDMTAKLIEIDKKIDTLEKKAEARKNDFQKKAAADYDKLQAKLSNDVEKLKADAEGDWKQAKNDLAISIDSLNTKVQQTLKE